MSAGDGTAAWTAEDETLYRQMATRRSRFEASRLEKLVRVAAALQFPVDSKIVVSTLREHAGELVAALEPYANDQLPRVKGDAV